MVVVGGCWCCCWLLVAFWWARIRWTSSSFVPEEERLRFLHIVCSSGALSWGEGG